MNYDATDPTSADDLVPNAGRPAFRVWNRFPQRNARQINCAVLLQPRPPYNSSGEKCLWRNTFK